MKSFTFIAVLLSLFIASLGVHHVLAQSDTLNLAASPLPISLSAPPGETVSAELRIRNNADQPEDLQVTLLKFSANDAGQINLEERGEGDDYFDWVTLTPRRFTADPGEWVTVNMTVDLPSEAAFGYYYAVAFSRAGEPATVPGGTLFEGRLVTFVLVEAQVPGAKRELEIASFTADKSSYEFLPAKFTVDVKNTGDVHLVPRGNIFIKRGSKDIATLSVNEAFGNVLPDSLRQFGSQWVEGFPVYVNKLENDQVVNDKQGNPVQTLKWDFSKVPQLRFGKYTAKLVLVYDDGQGDVALEAEVSFWVIPWRLVLFGVTIPVLPALLVYVLMKRRYRKKAGRPKS